MGHRCGDTGGTTASGEPCRQPTAEGERCHHHPFEDEEKPLTPKQEAFVTEYLIDRNATQAAIRAGYSPDSAYSIGWENLRKPEIASRIREELEERAMSAEEALDRLGRIARGSMAAFLSVEGDEMSLDLTSELAQWHFDLIQSYEVERKEFETGTITEITLKLYDKQKALKTILREHGGLEVKHTHEATGEEIAALLGIPAPDDDE
ncbi:MAG: terminase small subunit [Persicimonas sp.]